MKPALHETMSTAETLTAGRRSLLLLTTGDLHLSKLPTPADRHKREQPAPDAVSIVRLRMTTSTLYICYFGLHEPLVQTQVLPYLRHLAAAGLKVHLLTFEPRLKEKWNRDDLTRQRQRLSAEGISWSCLPYHKR